MTRFAIGQSVVTKVPKVVVDAGVLPAGAHRFRLVVVDDSGLSSAPAEAVLTVTRPLKPVVPVRPGGGLVLPVAGGVTLNPSPNTPPVLPPILPPSPPVL